MIRKLLLTTALIGTSFLFLPATSQACDTNMHSTLEQEKMSLSDLNKEKSQATLYDFRTGTCVPLSATQTGLKVSEFLPSDETILGVFQYYIDHGESQLDALKDTLRFDIQEHTS